MCVWGHVNGSSCRPGVVGMGLYRVMLMGLGLFMGSGMVGIKSGFV